MPCYIDKYSEKKRRGSQHVKKAAKPAVKKGGKSKPAAGMRKTKRGY